jgi:hypothetical protein
MLLFHGTNAENLPDMLSCGVNADSYWGTFEQAREFAQVFSDGIILQADIDVDDLQASLLMAESLYENGDIDEIPDASDVDYSLDNLGGCVCLVTITDFTVVEQD